ncbi:type II toxin-antitoxin system RelE/ParE family toxin [Streptomyces sp. NPDC056486]|uniref:type II toxin-antitoxin system RelE family toxin n=1 Tax=Streptomyces sp. NPDC056486 TaxID=3345835 RepID=UPI0036A9F52E
MTAIQLSPAARRSYTRLRRGDRRQAARVEAALAQLCAGQYPASARRLTGPRTGQHRVTIGKVRILYATAGGAVSIIAIGYRRDVYGGGAGHRN